MSVEVFSGFLADELCVSFLTLIVREVDSLFSEIETKFKARQRSSDLQHYTQRCLSTFRNWTINEEIAKTESLKSQVPKFADFMEYTLVKYARNVIEAEKITLRVNIPKSGEFFCRFMVLLQEIIATSRKDFDSLNTVDKRIVYCDVLRLACMHFVSVSSTASSTEIDIRPEDSVSCVNLDTRHAPAATQKSVFDLAVQQQIRDDAASESSQPITNAEFENK